MKPAAICTHPTEDEIAGRIARVQTKMVEKGLDYYLCHDPDNVFYLTNFANFVHERPFILLVPASGNMTFLMPKLEEPHVRIRSVGELEFLHYFEFPAPKGQQWSDRLQEVLLPNHRVGVESLCPLSVFQSVPGSPVPTDIVDEVRMVKSDYEIGRIVYTSQLVSEGHTILLAGARPDHMIIESNAEISSAITQKILHDNPNTNMLNTSFVGVSQPPHVSHDPHNFTDTFVKQVEGGPHVSIVSGTANGYGAEVERTFFLGQVPEGTQQPFEDMLEARALAYKLTVPGNSMSEVDRQVNEFFKSRGYTDNLLHRTGHGFGVTSHEAPFLAEGYEHEIQPGMVFSIEPGIYLPGVGGFRFSDTVLVTETGNLQLTQAPETLEELTLERKSSFRDTIRSWMISAASWWSRRRANHP
jgi:Xaa-Pro dipeptidase